jgi:hypothetical protein
MSQQAYLDRVTETVNPIKTTPERLSVKSFADKFSTPDRSIPVQTIIVAGDQADNFTAVINFVLGAIMVDENKAFEHISALREMVAEDLSHKVS